MLREDDCCGCFVIVLFVCFISDELFDSCVVLLFGVGEDPTSK